MATEATAQPGNSLPYGDIKDTLAVALDRDALLALLTHAIDSLRFKIEKGRIKTYKMKSCD
jgi:hypothetical protein